MTTAATAQKQTETNPAIYTFGEFCLDVTDRALYRSGERVHVQRKPFDVLAYLVTSAPRLVQREELLDRFFSRSVNDETLTRCISTIRKLLGDTEDPPRFIETQRAEGYRFVGELAVRPSPTQDVTVSPGRRRRWLVSTGLVVTVLALFFVGYAYRASEPLPPDYPMINRIAMLPIAVDDEGDAWLAAALTQLMIEAVSRIEGVTVVTLSEPPSPIGEAALGKELNVEAVIAGRLERRSGANRLIARLVATNDGRLLWSSTVDSSTAISDSSQAERLARQVARRLRPMLQLQDLPEPVDSAAYRHYLQGRYYWSQRSAVALAAAIDAFEAALQIEPDYTNALVGAAESWLLLPLYGSVPPSDAIPEARRLARRALDVDSKNARALSVAGAIAMLYDWNWSDAETLFRQAVTLNPNDATVQQRLGELYCYRSRFDDCRRQFAIARDLDPLSPVHAMQEGSVALWADDFDSAVRLYTSAIENHPDYALARYALGLAYAGREDWSNAIDVYQAVLPALGLATVGGPMTYALARSGDREGAYGVLVDLEELTNLRYVPPSKLAIAHLGLGDNQRALDLFRTAIEVRDDRLVYFGVDVHTRKLTQDPAFREIASRLGFWRGR